jgi:hypothetical protein
VPFWVADGFEAAFAADVRMGIWRRVCSVACGVVGFEVVDWLGSGLGINWKRFHLMCYNIPIKPPSP